MNEVVDSPFAARKAVAETAGARQDQSRELADMQVSYLMAQQFPRNPAKAMERILDAFKRLTLAEKSQYQYSRGGTEICGPSIKAMEAIATEWENIDVQWRIRSRGVDEKGLAYSEVEASAIDLQTRTRKRIGFMVSHWRDTRQGGYAIKDERDIYELCANMAQRRVRACIEAVIPSDVIEAAMAQADATLAKIDTGPEARAKMLAAFEPFGVTKAHVEARIQRNLEAIKPSQFVTLKRIYASLRDGESKPADWFDMPAQQTPVGSAAEASKTESIKARMREREPAKAETKVEQQKVDEHAPEQPATQAGELPLDEPAGPTYSAVGEAIQNANTVEELDTAADLIRSVKSLEDRELLTSEYRQKRDALDPPFESDPPPAQPERSRSRGRRS